MGRKFQISEDDYADLNITEKKPETGNPDKRENKNNAQEVQEVQHVHNNDKTKQDNADTIKPIISKKDENTQKSVTAEFGKTQGRKGMHVKRINMGFSDDNYEYITYESRRRGLSATAFVNNIISEYMNGSNAKISL